MNSACKGQLLDCLPTAPYVGREILKGGKPTNQVVSLALFLFAIYLPSPKMKEAPQFGLDLLSVVLYALRESTIAQGTSIDRK